MYRGHLRTCLSLWRVDGNSQLRARMVALSTHGEIIGEGSARSNMSTRLVRVVSAPTRVQFGPEKNNVCITSISCGWSHMLAHGEKRERVFLGQI